MIGIHLTRASNGGSAPAAPGFNAVAPEWLYHDRAAEAAPAIPVAESTLGFHPWSALSSAQVVPEWSNCNLAVHDFLLNGNYPLNFVSHSRGSLRLLQESTGGREKLGGAFDLSAPLRREKTGREDTGTGPGAIKS